MAKRRTGLKPIRYSEQTPEQKAAFIERRRITFLKHGLLTDLGFVWQGDRYKHPNGKMIYGTSYIRMDYPALIKALEHLGFKYLIDVPEVAATTEQ